MFGSEKRSPNFLIVGAPKSGTTSMYAYLKAHPEVYMSPVKEPCYFSDDPFGISEHADYLELFKDAGSVPVVGEASTTYLSDPAAAERIHRNLGSAKILIILRNPMRMIWSLWRHNRKAGIEPHDFLSAIQLEEQRCVTDVDPRYGPNTFAYVSRACYSRHIRRYLETFGTDNVRIYIFEEVFQNEERLRITYREICQFLEIDDTFRPEFGCYNVGGIARFPWLQKVLYPGARWQRYCKPLIPRSARLSLRRFVDWINTKPVTEPLSPAVEAELWVQYFCADAKRLEQILGRPIVAIWQPLHGGEGVGGWWQ